MSACLRKATNGASTATNFNKLENQYIVAGKNQNGFHLTIIILVALVLAVAGLAAWRVFRKNDQSQASTTASQAASGQTTSKKIDKIDTAQLKFDQSASATDPIGDRNGLFYHDVYTATSTDGVHFNPTGNKVAEHASVPDAIRLPSGQLVVYSVDGGGRSASGVLIAVSGDNGKSWKTGSAQVSKDRLGQAGADPQAVLTDSGQLRLYYVVFPGKPVPGQPPSTDSVNKVYSATSADGLNFTEEQGVRFEYSQITDPDVIKIGSTWFMYAAQGQKQIYATATDGLSFSYKGTIRDKGSVSKTVPVGGTYRQFYCAQGITSEISTDGITWQNPTPSLPAPVGKIICDPSPLQLDDNSWLMIYKLASANQ